MRMILQADEPDDYVVATGEAHTVEEFVAAAFEHVGLDWREYVRFDEEFARGASDAPVLVGDPSKIRDRLGWNPEVGFDDLVKLLVDADLAELKAQAHSGGDTMDSSGSVTQLGVSALLRPVVGIFDQRSSIALRPAGELWIWRTCPFPRRSRIAKRDDLPADGSGTFRRTAAALVADPDHETTAADR